MGTSFNDDNDDLDGDDDNDNGDYDEDFDDVIDSDGDGFSDDYEEFIGSDPKDPTDLPFYPYEDLTETFPKKRQTLPITEEQNHRLIRLSKGSPTRNKCILFLFLFIFLLILFPFIVFIILS